MKRFDPCLLLLFGILFYGCGGDSSPGPQPVDTDPDVDQINNCTVVNGGLPLADNVNILGLGRVLNDADAVYVYTYSGGDGGAIQRISKSDNTVRFLGNQLQGINAMATDATHLYWLEYNISTGAGQVKRTAKDGSTVAEVLAESFPPLPDGSTSTFNVFFPNGLALDNNFLYWGEEAGSGAIRKIAKSGGSVEDIGRGTGFNPMALAADDANIYVLNASNSGQILQFSKSDGTRSLLVSNFATTEGFSPLELRDGVLYWSEITNPGSAFKLVLSSGIMSTVKNTMINPRNVLANTTHIYIAASNGVFKIDIDTGSETNITCNNVSIPYTISIDDSFIYILDNPSGEDGKIVKERL